MILKRFKIQPLGLFIINILSIVLLAIVFWNSILKTGAGVSFWSVFLLAIALISACIFYITYMKETNPEALNSIIEKKVEEERSSILAEFNKKEEIVEEVKIDLDEIINKIIPKGNFKNIGSFVSKFLQNLANEVEVSQGIFYSHDDEKNNYNFLCGYALADEENITSFKAGENLTGQTAVTKEIMVIKEIPDNYIIESGLGKGKPVHLFIVPVLNVDECIAVIELATFKSDIDQITDILKNIVTPLSDKLLQMKKS